MDASFKWFQRLHFGTSMPSGGVHPINFRRLIRWLNFRRLIRWLRLLLRQILIALLAEPVINPA
jgi:hypothetical protein